MSEIVFLGKPGGQRLEEGAAWPLCDTVRAVLSERFLSARAVGIIAPTGPALIQVWQACMDEGRKPLILHYPTAKLSRVYWQQTIAQAVQSLSVDLLICADAACAPEIDGVPCLLVDRLRPARLSRLSSSLRTLINQLRPTGSSGLNKRLGTDGSILQMSSGTTGHRKGLEFSMASVARHIDNYNELLRIGQTDCIVSWLPLYHDMGFIAGFLMPRLLGCKLVLIDPMEWVQHPEILWDAIEREHGTICYMPNFGFEVMATHPRVLPSMRMWVSCSEPTRASTMRRFIAATQASEKSVVNCWGMAENVYAVCQSSGIATRVVDGAEVVSCGPPIPGVAVKVVDGEIYVKSSYSLDAYIGTSPIVDAEGFYPTGDLGEIVDGEVYLGGRRQDIVNNAGRKIFLTDIDFAIGELVPEAAGRIATFAREDEALGTQTPVALIEHPEFWLRNRDHDFIHRIINRTGVEGAVASFVPPRFITKTSSGKVNRRQSGAHWLALGRGDRGAAGMASTPRERASTEILASLPWIDLTLPLNDQIDSLGFVNVALILSKHGLVTHIEPNQSLAEILSTAAGDRDNRSSDNTIKIVSLCDANPLTHLGRSVLERVIDESSIPVHIKHLCVPPSSILLSDIIFSDYFQIRDDRPQIYEPLNRVLDELRTASVVLVDDLIQVFWPSHNRAVYPIISHDFREDPDTAFLAVRWAGYTENHHLLKCGLLPGSSILADRMTTDLQQLESYLRVPFVRVAYDRTLAEATSDWEVGVHGDAWEIAALSEYKSVDRPKFERELFEAIMSAVQRGPQRVGTPSSYMDFNDQPHWCSWMIGREIIEFVLDNFSNIAVLGKPSSIPYLAQAALERNIRLQYRLDISVPDDCDCVVLAGFWGEPKTDKPIFQIMAGGSAAGLAINLPAHLVDKCPAYLV